MSERSIIPKIGRNATHTQDVSPQSINNLFNLKLLVGKMSLEHCRALLVRFRRQHSEYSTTAQVIEHENISRMLAAEVKAHDAQVALQREAVKFKDSYNAYKVAEAKAKAAAIKAGILKIRTEGAAMRTRDARAKAKGTADAFEATKVEARRELDHIEECKKIAGERVIVVVERMWELGVLDGDVDAMAEQKDVD